MYSVGKKEDIMDVIGYVKGFVVLLLLNFPSSLSKVGL